MTGDLLALSSTALAIGVTHTLLGPDHYLPFVALSRSRNWSRSRTLLITGLCGVGHVLGSIALGLVGLAAGVLVGKLEAFEAFRGDLAATLLFSFGVVYMLWGLWKFFQHDEHHHHHLLHEAGISHHHDNAEHHHHHESPEQASPETNSKNTIWLIFIIFVLGPCEPLIPLLMYPASGKNFTAVVIVALVFAVATIGTMLAVVTALDAGFRTLKLNLMERLSHFLAGAAITACGAAILFLGL